MTRKKYVKQLMALGVQRNDANASAILHNYQGHPYSRALKEERLRLSINRAFKTLGDTALQMAIGIGKAAAAMQTLADALKQAEKRRHHSET